MNANFDDYFLCVMFLVAARSKTSVCGRSLDEISGSNPVGGWMSLPCEYCMLSGRGLDLPSVLCLIECDREAAIMRCLSPLGYFVP